MSVGSNIDSPPLPDKRFPVSPRLATNIHLLPSPQPQSSTAVISSPQPHSTTAAIRSSPRLSIRHPSQETFLTPKISGIKVLSGGIGTPSDIDLLDAGHSSVTHDLPIAFSSSDSEMSPVVSQGNISDSDVHPILFNKQKVKMFSINPTPVVLNELKFDDKGELIFDSLDIKAPKNKKQTAINTFFEGGKSNVKFVNSPDMLKNKKGKKIQLQRIKKNCFHPQTSKICTTTSLRRISR